MGHIFSNPKIYIMLDQQFFYGSPDLLKDFLDLSVHRGCALGQSGIMALAPDSLKRNSAIAEKPRDAFRGQSRSPNMLGMVSY